MAEDQPASWHPDPDDPSQLRYWDGSQWTDHRSPVGGNPVGPDPTMQMPVGETPAVGTTPGKKTSPLLYIGIPIAACVALLLVAGVIGAIAGSTDDEGDVLAASGPSTSSTEADTTEPATTSAPTTAPPTTTAAPTTAPPTTAPPTTAPPTTAAPEVPMPDVTCMNLQMAQDTIQTAGVFFSRSEDATGAGRRQVLDSNWIVVGQTPAPGALIGEGEAVLSVVKIGEPAPC